MRQRRSKDGVEHNRGCEGLSRPNKIHLRGERTCGHQFEILTQVPRPGHSSVKHFFMVDFPEATVSPSVSG